MTSPSRDPVQEARDDDALILTILESRISHEHSCAFPAHPHHKDCDCGIECDCNRRELVAIVREWKRLAALRASLVEKVMGKVEALQRYGIAGAPDVSTFAKNESQAGRLLRRADVLAVLRAELNSGEGT